MPVSTRIGFSAYETTVDREYFVVTKVTWVKCSMSFNFVNLAGIRNLFNSGYFITRSFSALLARA